MDGAKKEMRDARLRGILRALRDHHGSNAALARALKVEGPTVTEILNGKRGVGLEMIEAIADLTGRSLDDLCGRTATPLPGSLSSHVRWSAARLDAERMLAHIRPDILRAAMDRVGSFALTGLFVARLAEAVISNPQEFLR
jgi:transcriptional regulator with XRE-family HTH domain